MRAGVQHCLEFALAIAGKENVSPTDRTGDKIPGLGEFGTVAEVEPAFVEYLCPLGFQNIGIDKGAPRNLEYLPGFVDHERGVHPLERVHCCLSLRNSLLFISRPPANRKRVIQGRHGMVARLRRSRAVAWPSPWRR